MNPSTPPRPLLAALQDRTESVTVWGAGFIGLSAACALAEAGFSCAVLDIDEHRVREINAGVVPLPGFEDVIPLADARSGGRLRAATPDDTAAVAARVHLVCVNTDRDGRPVTGPLTTVLTAIGRARTGGETLIALESTVSLRWLDELVPAALDADPTTEASLHLVAAPRRDWMLSPDMNLRSLPRVLGTARPESLPVARELYDAISDVVHPAPDWRHAGLTKPVENLYRYLDLVLTNQLAEAYPGLDVPEVLRLAGTKWNVPTFHPSIGIGGYCIPLSPRFAVDGVDEDTVLPLVTSAMSWDGDHPARVAESILRIADGPIGILGLSYAPNARIVEGSPARRIAEHLLARGADVLLHDPYFTPEEITALTGARPLRWPDDLGSLGTLIAATPHALYGDLPSRLAGLQNPPTVVDNLGGYGAALRDTAVRYAEWGTPATRP
ncbi:UDP-N-acetyl-D-mannosaminuronic acid dehydrogenase [Streptomyces cellostaticus]|uniref:UDP-N-acetyl-D-mannosaminuronic acid dehydrogenase n=1 Tax=Streptomyces cellostaticus TaxID=67285 RepID=A0A117PVC3_9ACTN|nr:UDP binding domain-containing protein [Streptomyces cellostaticus]KUM93513.1 UDP-N-acetyl-D-mannosaminuronic acid dehydrogenase [Streptomyces cellostaticus]GHI10165.1 UDP-N-acetyl-D-mannosaminuronic acid dehydrogenase [Streptomyces cellostaticus]